MATFAERLATQVGAHDTTPHQGHKNPIFKILEALDLPRAVVVGLGEEIGTDLRAPFGRDHDGAGPGVGKTFWRDVTGHKGVGAVLHDHGVSTNNQWGDRALGFAGDVAADPLTFLGGGASKVDKAGKLTELTGNEAARLLAEKAGQAGERGEGELQRKLLEAADKAASRGMKKATNLSAEMLDQIGAKAGLKFHVPFTKIEAQSSQGGQLLEALNKVKSPIMDAIKETGPVRKLRDLLEPIPGLNEVRHTEDLGHLKAMTFTDILRSSGRKAAGLAAEGAHELRDIIKRHGDVDTSALRVAMEGGEVADTKVAAAAADLRGWFDRTADRAAAASGRDIPRLDNYLPHKMTAAFREYLSEAKGRAGYVPSGKVAAEMKREFKPGAKWFGETLETGSIDELNRIASEKLGPNYAQVFEGDPFKLADAYLADMQRSVRGHMADAKIAASDLLSADGATAEQKVAGGVAADAAAVSPNAASPFGRGPADLSSATDPLSKVKQWFEQARAAADAATPEEAVHNLNAEADQMANDIPPVGFEDGARRMRDPKVAAAMSDMLNTGVDDFLKGRVTEPWLAKELEAVREMSKPQQVGKFLKTFDWVTNRWKAYALLSPGFHMRNFMGGMFNNWLAGVDLESYDKFFRANHQFSKALKGGAELDAAFNAIKDVDARRIFRQIHEAGGLGDLNVRDLSDVRAGAEGATRGGGGALRDQYAKFDPTSLNNAVLGKNGQAAEAVERQLRGTLMMDRMSKGSTLEGAFEAVDKYHFEYSDLSPFEKKVAKRVVPFYTWSRKNFPLQVEAMMTQPGKYTMYLHLKRNMEAGTTPDDNVPGFYQDLLAIKSPFKVGGQANGAPDAPMYLTPDLPFRDLAEQFDPVHALGQVNTIIKTPIEALLGKSFDQGITLDDKLKPVPKTWYPLMPLLAAAHGTLGLPKPVKSAKGTWLLSTKDAYKIEQMLPLAGRGRRLAPSETRFQNRQSTSLLSFLSGISAQTLDATTQAGVAAQRKNDRVKQKQRDQAIRGL